MFKDRALAKINLTLDVLGKRDDGYHELNSLVTFADVGDALSFTPLAQDSYTLTSEGFMVEGENIILKAAMLFKAKFGDTPYGAFHLVKNLPIASGIGGGSSDAASALRLLSKALGRDVDLSEFAVKLGADVSVCLSQKTRVMRGIGHNLGAEIVHEKLYFVLVNPLQGVSTKEIFKRLDAKPLISKATDSAFDDFISGKNDLQPIAIKLLPIIGEIITELEKQNPIVARMSGSGATCFAVFETLEKAESAKKILQQRFPFFWVV